jgi:hypothetical protein
MKKRLPTISLVAALGAAALSACGAPGSADSSDGASDGSTFIAFGDDFSHFTAWKSFQDDVGPSTDPHTMGPRTEYINALPPEGATRFPVGTIIVKVIEDTATIFAMVKRGGGFNADGAVEWEWFELGDNGDGTYAVQWRGVAPTSSTDPYTKMGNTCNDCHGGFASNDYVESTKLQLSVLAK